MGEDMPTTYESRTTTTTSGPSGLSIRREYITSVPGLFKIAEMVVCFITFICSVVYPRYKGDGWVEFVSMSALLTVGINFIFYLIGLRQQLPPFMLLVEFIVYCVFTVFFAIAAIVAAVSGSYHASIGATAFFAFAATAIFGVDTFFQFRAWQDGQTHMTTGATTTTTTTSETTAQY
ncbi:hypothetical protein NP493_122g00000 [Ridgeia piscesae]|uniref:MARVEL domain-containing protein n=1 Tax=Ridgeia piscesae TaxID=27915 RepID=A0AAD9P695_RIDPI|nr:hypothetical protein NP493_122g00000 [Ridgeia piscesae]